MTAPRIAPKITSSKIIHVRTNAIKEGTEMITAITVPRRIISFFVRLIDCLLSDDRSILKTRKTKYIFSFVYIQYF